MKKKKKTAGRMFVQGFLKSILYVMAFFVLAFASYKITMVYYSTIGDAGKNESLSKYIADIQSDGVAEAVSKNMILAVDEDNEKIKKILIEVCNKNTGNLDYITVPNNMEFTLSYELYKKLATANSEVPQIIAMEKVNKYFQGENLYQCAQLLLEDAMDIKFSYYTIIPYGVYQDMFRTEKRSGIQKWKAAYEKEMESLTTEQEYETFFEKYYEKVESNLSEKNKNTYAATYLKAVPDQVRFSKVSGEKAEKGFALAVEETNYIINKILENPPYTEQSNDRSSDEGVTTSVGRSVEIYNSTSVNGLASAYSEKLTNIGVNVVGIGNYNGETLEHTKIIVAKEGYGQDLQAYFKDAQIEVGELDPGVDICIIIGSADGQI